MGVASGTALSVAPSLGGRNEGTAPPHSWSVGRGLELGWWARAARFHQYMGVNLGHSEGSVSVVLAVGVI